MEKHMHTIFLVVMVNRENDRETPLRAYGTKEEADYEANAETRELCVLIGKRSCIDALLADEFADRPGETQADFEGRRRRELWKKFGHPSHLPYDEKDFDLISFKVEGLPYFDNALTETPAPDATP